jgi:signal transduction histidine kinase
MRDVSERQAFEELQHRLTESVATVGVTLDLAPTERSVVQLPVPWLADGAFLDLMGSARHFTRLAARTDDATLDSAAARFIAMPLNEDSAWPVIDAWSRRRRERVDEVTDEWIEARATTPEEEARTRALGMRTVLFLPLVARDHALGVLTLFRRSGTPFTMREVAVAEELALRAAFALDNAQLYASARQATQARDHALGVVSHDLRNPISAMGMSARALLASLPEDDSERRGMLSNIIASQELTQRMIRDLLDVANIETGHLAVESMTERVEPMLERAIALLAGEAEARGVQLSLAPIRAPLPAVIADRERVVQALCNLLSNAIRYTRRDGQVMVRVQLRDHEMEIAVADTGAGIAPAAMPMIFERYWTVRGNAPKGGTGLGLAIARGIIEALGGRLWAESEEGKGSTFRFTLRIAA